MKSPMNAKVPTVLVIYLVLTATFNTIIFTTPFIYMYDRGIGEGVYRAFSFICHQVPSRSFCIYPDAFAVSGCSAMTNGIVSVDPVLGMGYKFPVCARCISFYTGMFIGGLMLLFIFFRRGGYPILPVWLFIMFIIPMGVDGTFQLLGFWESTNTVRVLTGFPAGFIVPFYLMPILDKSRAQWSG
ncbi:DUF2085 domain-containing protein [Candidatus Micrarchaeota archaeon]|nr:DUF2085 domain-containing protein [Candidatus Micrarchaeota archaeon]